jgi:hypothetical protein
MEENYAGTPDNSIQNVVFDLGPGRLVIVAGVKLVARRSEICVKDCEVSLPWDGPQFSLWALGDERLDYRVAPDVVFAREGPEPSPRREPATQAWRTGCGAADCVGIQFPVAPEYPHGAPLTVGLTFIDRAGEAVAQPKEKFGSIENSEVRRGLGCRGKAAASWKRRTV